MDCASCGTGFSNTVTSQFPHSAPCGHILCKRCSSNSVCPIDHRPFPVSEIPIHKPLLTLLHSPRADEFKFSAPQSCDLCDDDSSLAKYRCRVENLYFCTKHAKLHKSKLKTMHHAMVEVKEEERNLEMLVEADKVCQKHFEKDGHTKQLTRFMCAVCEVLICRTCYTDEHRGHRVVQIRDAMRLERNRQAQVLTEIEKLLVDFQEMKNKLVNLDNELDSVAKKEMEKMNNYFAEISQEINNREEVLTKELYSAVTEKENLLVNAPILNSFLVHLERRKDQVIPSLEKTIHFNEFLEKYKGNISADALLFYVSDSKSISNTSKFGAVNGYEIDESLCTASGTGLERVGKSFRGKFTITTFASSKMPFGTCADILDVSLEGEMKSDPIIEIVNKEAGIFHVSYQLFEPTLKEVTLRVRCKGKDIAKSPFKVKIHRETMGFHVRKFGSNGSGAGQLSGPWSVAICDEGVFVSEYTNHRISVFEHDGKFLRSFGARGAGNGQLNTPEGIHIAGEEIYICDYGNHRVVVYNLKGEQLRTWGSSGNGDGMFQNPIGIYVSGDEVFVAEHTGNRVQVFEKNGRFLRKWGSAGSGEGQFSSLWDVHVTNLEVYCCEYGNHRISVFDKFGGFKNHIGGSGSGDGKFNCPEGVCVDQEIIYVADYSNNRIQMFDLSGKFIRKFGGSGSADGQFSGPIGVSYYKGELYVSEYNNHRIQVLE